MKNIRNFCIIAHIDHGKSTLSDRLLEITGTIEKREMKEQLLDTMDLERERGITIKLQPVQMKYKQDATDYILNLIDTPGHVDFAYEVSRSLAAVEGAVLLVDATQGVQAQTLTNLYFALEQDLEIIPVLNKIDLPNADVEKVKKEIVHILGCREDEILAVSGKTGEGVEKLLEEIIKRVPAPKGKLQDYESGQTESLRALIFDSVYDSYKGVLAYVRIVDGEINKTDKLHMLMTGGESGVVELGHFAPKYIPCEKLVAGDIGYIATGFKSVKECKVGDTITLIQNFKDSKNKANDISNSTIEPLPGYAEVQPMVYASFYPLDGSDYNMMRDALDKLTLNDGAFTFEPESNQALGRGFRCGFLGLLHLEIIQARLEREFKMQPTITTPSVVYRIHKSGTDEIFDIYSPTELPDASQISLIEEPYVRLELITPAEYLGNVMELMGNTRAEYKSTDYIDSERVQLVFEAPLMDVIVDFHDQLKSVSSGYASMSYEPIDYRASDLVRIDILVAGDQVEAFSRIVPKERALNEGKTVVNKLKEILPRQNFAVAIQAAIGAKIIARATISAFRKDVTAGLYGGDITRKRKLLEKQKKGKKRMAQGGKIEIPPEAFLQVLKR
jgi:GTP-binding protein LepA